MIVLVPAVQAMVKTPFFKTVLHIKSGKGMSLFTAAVLLGMLIGVADVLPVIGAGLFLNTWAIGALIIGDYYTALGLFIIYLVTVTVRQIIEPRIVGKQLGLYPLVTMMSMFAGFQIMGTLGLIAGPLVANICKVTLDADAGKLEPGTQKNVLPWSRLWDSLRRKNKKSK